MENYILYKTKLRDIVLERMDYSRETEDQKLLVICSYSDKPTALKVPRGFDLTKGKLILANYPNQQSKLRPYECRVYLWE